MDIPSTMLCGSNGLETFSGKINCTHCQQTVEGNPLGLCLMFPHVDGSDLVICMDCVYDIDSKLVPVKFTKLKKKKKITKKNKNASREPLIRKNKNPLREPLLKKKDKVWR